MPVLDGVQTTALAGAIGRGGDSGETAQQISNASFATLSLIYSFTETLNLSDDLATLAGLTARVAFLKEVSSCFHPWTSDLDVIEVVAMGEQPLCSAKFIVRCIPRMIELRLRCGF